MDLVCFGIIALIVGTSSASEELGTTRNTVIQARNEPFQVFVGSSGGGFDFGAGIALTPKHVVTSADLIYGYTAWRIGFGNSLLANLTYLQTTVALVNPNYNSVTKSHNIGMVILRQSFPAGIVRPISHPTGTDIFPRVNQEGRIIGFGLLAALPTGAENLQPNSYLKTVYQTVHDSRVCSAAFSNYDNRNTFCASDDRKNATNLCKGDSGNAFVVMVRGTQVLGGFSSVISSACASNDVVLYTRIQPYINWLLTIINA